MTETLCRSLLAAARRSAACAARQRASEGHRAVHAHVDAVLRGYVHQPSAAAVLAPWPGVEVVEQRPDVRERRDAPRVQGFGGSHRLLKGRHELAVRPLDCWRRVDRLQRGVEVAQQQLRDIEELPHGIDRVLLPPVPQCGRCRTLKLLDRLADLEDEAVLVGVEASEVLLER